MEELKNEEIKNVEEQLNRVRADLESQLEAQTQNAKDRLANQESEWVARLEQLEKWKDADIDELKQEAARPKAEIAAQAAEHEREKKEILAKMEQA